MKRTRPVTLFNRVPALALIATARVCAATDITTTIPFDDFSLPPPTVYLTDRYHAQGVDFVVGGVDVGTAPRVQYVGTPLANSGGWVVLINYEFSEFNYGRMSGLLVNNAREVSAYVGRFAAASAPGDTTQVKLTAYDVSHNIVGAPAIVTVTEGAGFHTLIRVTSATANIASFVIDTTRPEDKGDPVGVDDLRFVTVSEPLPPMSARLAGGNTIVLSWPNPSTGYVLQQSANMNGPGGGWADVTQPSVINGSNKEVTLLATGRACMFRLRHL